MTNHQLQNVCCKVTFRKALEEVALNIKQNIHLTSVEILGGLEYAIKSLKDKEKEDAV